MGILLLPLRLAALFVQSVSLALGQIWLHKTKAALATTGILIGIAATMAVTAGLLGFRDEIVFELKGAGLRTVFLSAERPDSGPRAHWLASQLRFLPEQVDPIAQSCPSVEEVSKLVWVRSGARHGSRYTDDVDVMGVTDNHYKVMNLAVLRGRPISREDRENRRNVCVITPPIIEALDLSPEAVGDEIVMLGRTWRVVGVVGLLYRGMFVQNGDSTPEIYIPFETVYDRDVSGISVALLARSPEQVYDAAAESTFLLRRTRSIGPGEPDDFSVTSIRSVMDRFRTVAAGVTVAAVAVVGLSLVVGGVGIMNIMLVSVSQRTREIGLRKALGASSTAVMLQFVVEATSVCLMGGALGVAAGEAVAAVMRTLADGALRMAFVPWWAIVMAFTVSTAIGLFFGLFPAVRAARLDPIEALRNE